jgi:hypothetical protein
MLITVQLILQTGAQPGTDCVLPVWTDVCDYTTRNCTVVAYMCAPFNSLDGFIASASSSLIDSSGWRIDLLPYIACSATDTPASCLSKARTAAAIDTTRRQPDGRVWGSFSWGAYDVDLSNLLIRGPATITLDVETAQSNGASPLCRAFKFLGQNTTLANVTIDLTGCMGAYGGAQTRGDDGLAIEFAGKSAANSRVTGVAITGATIGVRANLPGGVVDLTNASFAFTCAGACVPLVLYHYSGANITAAVSLAITKQGTIDGNVTVSALHYNISDLVSPVDMFAVPTYPPLSPGLLQHSSAQTGIFYALVCLSAAVVVFVIFEIVHKCAKKHN